MMFGEEFAVSMVRSRSLSSQTPFSWPITIGPASVTGMTPAVTARGPLLLLSPPPAAAAVSSSESEPPHATRPAAIRAVRATTPDRVSARAMCFLLGSGAPTR
jgi:hypothetical protein